MKIATDKLAAALKQTLLPLYLVSGDDVLLVNESADLIRRAAREQGFLAREVYHADSSTYDWIPFLEAANSLSLFAEKKLVEVRSTRKNLASDTFLSFWEQTHPDIVVLVITDKIDRQTQSTRWFTTLEKAGGFVPVWPLELARLPAWLAQRARQAGLALAPEAIEILRDRTEGNLLAAAQEIDKLRLLYGDETVTAAHLREAVVDHARYDVYGLVDASHRGECDAVVRMLRSLLEEGELPFAILGVVLRELRLLVHASEAVARGQPGGSALSALGVWEKRQPLLQQTLKRHTARTLNTLLQRACRIDLAVKGMDALNPADALENLLLALAGKKIAA